MLLSVQNIAKQYGGEKIFDGLSFVIEEGHKIALVGKNGVGKSTLLKLIAGLEEVDNGSVVLTPQKRLAYLPQEVDQTNTQTGLEYIQDGLDIQLHQCVPILEGLGVSQEIASQRLVDMSGGQQTKILLTRFLLVPSDILLLDEPTNNLDIPSLLWLEAFLVESKKAMLIVSHDLFFLDAVANRVFEVKEGGIQTERGSYSDYLTRRQKELLRQRKEYKLYQEKVSQLGKAIAVAQQKGEEIDKSDASDGDKFSAGRSRDKASASQSASRVLKKKIERLEVIEKPMDVEPLVLDIAPQNFEGVYISTEKLVVGYKDGVRIGPIDFDLQPGHRVCLMGMNGAGKSTILKTITGSLPPLEGEITVGEGVIFGDLLQQHERADRSQKVYDFFLSETGKGTEQAMHLLKKVGFTEQSIGQRVGGLSSGMRARLLFAIFISLDVNVLILDEPTNHLDMEGISALKELLQVYKGIVIVVSHNRWFLEGLDVGVYYDVSDGRLQRIKEFDEYVAMAKGRALTLMKRVKRLSHSLK